MDALQQGIITLIRSALTEERYTLPQDFDLESAYEQLCRHHIVPMAYIGAVQCGISQELPVMQKLSQDYLEYKARSEQQMKALEQLFAAFDRAGIEYMPLRGCDLKVLYPKPEMRLIGDADMLVRLEQYERMKQIMTKLEYEEQAEEDRTLIWNKDPLRLKLHRRLIPAYNKAYRAYFGDGWLLASLRSGTQYSMSREDKFVYLFTLFAKHYYDGDIDCRYAIDLWVFRRAYTAFNDTYIRAELKKLRLLTFYDNVQEMLSAWFEDANETEKTDLMTDSIFNSSFSQDFDQRARNDVGLRMRFKEKKSIFQMLMP